MEKFTLDYEVNAKNLIDFFGYTKLIDYVKMDNEDYPIFPRLSDITKDVEDIGWAPFKTCDQIVFLKYQFTHHVDFPRKVEEMNRMELVRRYLETFIKSFNSDLDEHIIKKLQESALTINLEEMKQTKVKQNSTIISPYLMEKSDDKRNNYGFGRRSVSYLLEDKSFIVSNNLDQLNYYVYSDTIQVVRSLDRISILGDLKIGFNLEGFQLYRIEEKEKEKEKEE